MAKGSKKIAIGILAKDEIPHLDALKEAGYSEIYAHFHAGRHARMPLNNEACRPGTLLDNGVQAVYPVQTSWEHTINAHIMLWSYFANSNATHMAILSESCIPIRTHNQAVECLDYGISYAWSPWRNDFIPPHQVHKYRAAYIPDPVWRSKMMYHEQWYIISREHAALLFHHKNMIIKQFERVFADNEHMLGTGLNVMGRLNELEWMRVTYAKWAAGTSHPATFTRDTLPAEAQKFLFARKVLI